MKRILWFLLLGCLLLTGAYAEGNGEHIQTIQDGVNSVLNGLDFSQTVDMALNVPGWGEHESVEQVVRRIATGEVFSADDVLNMLTGSFAKELQTLSKMMLSIMLPVLLVSLLTHTLIPQYDSLLTVSKSVSSVLVLTPIIVMTISELEHTKETIIAMTQRMERDAAYAADIADSVRRKCFIGISAPNGCRSIRQYGFSRKRGHSATGDVYLCGYDGQSSV